MTSPRTTYSLAQAADEICGDSLREPVRWLRQRIRAGEIRAYQVGRRWRMRREDIDAAIERFSNDVSQTTQLAEVTPMGITAASLRRRRRRGS